MSVGALAIAVVLTIVGCSSADSDSASNQSASGASAASGGDGGVAAGDSGVPVSVNDSGFSVTDEPDATSGEVEQVPPDEVVTEGTPPPTFVYTEEIKPADTLVATLCTLNSGAMRSLRNEDASGTPIVDDDLRLAVVSLGDNVSLWRDLVLSFPDIEDDVATGNRVLELWSDAVLARDNGQDVDANEFMQRAEDAIDQLPEFHPEGIDGCK